MRTIIENEFLCNRFLDVHLLIAEKLKLIKTTDYPSLGILEILNSEFQGKPFELLTILDLSHKWMNDKHDNDEYGVCYNDGNYVFIRYHRSCGINSKWYHHYDVNYLSDNEDGITLVEHAMDIPMNL